MTKAEQLNSNWIKPKKEPTIGRTSNGSFGQSSKGNFGKTPFVIKAKAKAKEELPYLAWL